MTGRWSQAGMAALGVLAVVLLMCGNELLVSAGGSPPLHATAADYGAAVGTSAGALIGGFVVLVAFLALAGFFLGLAGTLRRFGATSLATTAISGGAVLTAAVGFAGGPPLLAAGIMAADKDLTPQLAKALILFNAATFILTWVTCAVPIGVSAIAGMKTHTLPRWLGYPGAVLAALLPVAALTVLRAEDLTLVWFLAILWVAVTSITLTWRALRTPHPAHLATTPGLPG